MDLMKRIKDLERRVVDLYGKTKALEAGGGSAVGALQVLGGGPVTATLQQVVDSDNNPTTLYVSTNQITSYGIGGPASFSTAFGPLALKAVTSGIVNIAYGAAALTNVTIGSYNTAIGGSAMEAYNDLDGSATKGQNVAVGSSAMRYTIAGKWNTVVGTSAMQSSNSGGSFNTVLGAHAGENLQGSTNIAIGFYAGSQVSGNSNIIIENGAAIGGGVTSGGFNIVINPRQKSGITTGSNNTVIGGFAGTIGAAVNDSVFIGNGAGAMRLSFDTAGSTMTISVAPLAGTGAATEKILVRDTAAGAVKAIDYVATNATASALSLATLNATYTTATLGFRVICMSIAGGALVYTKTGASSWASSTLTAVA